MCRTAAISSAFCTPCSTRSASSRPVRAIVVAGRPVNADVAVPSPKRFLAAICGERAVRLSGTVASVSTGAPIAGAQVTLIGGPQATSNVRGEWILADLPLGTRTLEVRALGYYPERRAVNVFTGAPSVHVALSTFRAVLDTVRVTASRWRDEHRLAFDARRRQGLGRYFTAEQIARRAPVEASDIFRSVAGVAPRTAGSNFGGGTRTAPRRSTSTGSTFSR